MVERTPLRVAMGDWPLARALRDRVSSTRVDLSFDTVDPVHKAFAPMVRRQAFDASELAIVTALQAHAYGVPVVLLPVVVTSRFQRGCLIGHRDRGIPKPENLGNKRVAVRAYTQTTGMWVRAHLAEDYGLPIAAMNWFTRDPAHVEQYEDPPFVQPLPSEGSLPDLLDDGVIDAAILGNDLPEDDRFAPLIADAHERDLAWWDKHGFMPINHMVAVTSDLCQRDPAAVRELYRMLVEAEHMARLPGDQPQPTLCGFQALVEPMQWIIETCLAQQLLPKHLTADDVFAPARAVLGAPA